MKKYLQPSAGGTERTCPETGTVSGQVLSAIVRKYIG